MNFPLRNLTNQYISASYQDVLQQYLPSDTFYVLDGRGNVIFTLPSSSVGQMLIASNLTASMTVATASYVQTSSYLNILIQSSSFASSSLSASYSYSSSHSENSDNADFALASYYSTTSETSSYLYGNGIITKGIQFDTSSAESIQKEGYLYWDNEYHTLAIKPDISGSTLQVGQETWMRYIAGENINNGDVLYISTNASSTTLPILKKAIADGTRTKYAAVAVATNDVISGSQNIATIVGLVHDLNTSAYPAGSPIFLSDTTLGGFRLGPPNEPHERILIGYVTHQDVTRGSIYIGIVGLPDTFRTFVGITELPSIITSSMSSSGSIVTVGTGSATFCTTADGTGVLRNYTLNSASFILTSSFLDIQYVVANYNSGNPRYDLVTNKNNVDSIQSTLVYTLLLESGGRVSYANWDTPGILLANKDNLRVQALRGIERENGLLLSYSGSRHVTITNGAVWQGIQRISLPSITSSVDRLVLAAHSSSVWSGSTITQYVNNVYDDGINLVPLSNNHYVTNWVYRTIGNLDSTVITLGTQYNKPADAISASPPQTPVELRDVAILVGRAIYKKGENIPYQIDSAFTEDFFGGITIHNNLIGLQGGLTNEYYHLNSTEYAQFQSGTSSYSNRSLTASYAKNVNEFTLTSGSFYPISSSWAISASWAPGSGTSVSASYSLTASYALNAGQSGGTTLTTGSFYPITSSWSQYALTASYVNVIPSGSTESASYALTASYVSNIGGLSIPPYDYSNIVYSGPNGQIGKCTYRSGGISGSIVAEVTAIYNGNIFMGVSKSLG